MSFYFKHCFKLFLVWLGCFSVSTQAALWPVFRAPDKEFLLANGFIETHECSVGEGKLVAGAIVDMQLLCGSYCPSRWNWQATSDGKCHLLDRDFVLQKFEFVHFPDPHENNNAPVLYTKIIAHYGRKDSESSLFQFVFTTPQEHWYCIEMNPELHLLTCANDMYLTKVKINK